jgi:hypothetical protein
VGSRSGRRRRGIWSEVVQEVLDERAVAGLPVPTMKAATASKVALVLPTDFQTPPKKTAKGSWEAKSSEELAQLLIPFVLDCANRNRR